MDIQTMTHVLIRMDEHEADSVLSDPSEFQSALRSVLKNGGG